MDNFVGRFARKGTDANVGPSLLVGEQLPRPLRLWAAFGVLDSVLQVVTYGQCMRRTNTVLSELGGSRDEKLHGRSDVIWMEYWLRTRLGTNGSG